MPEFDLMRVDQCAADEKLGDSGLLEAPAAGSYDVAPVDVEVKLAVPGCLQRSAGRPAPARRGRPPRSLAKDASSPPSTVSQQRKRREEEDVCFVCFDGGSLVVCDRRGCPKAYHPACVKRTEAFFKSRAKWNCGWHICTTCHKGSFYMCYTCPYSICKRCVRSSEYVVVRGDKGFCKVCMKTIMLIENAAEANKEKVDFDDQSSWEYLFKIYWVSLKEKLSLSLDDLTKAKNPWKSASSTSSKGKLKNRLFDHDDGNISFSHNPCGDVKVHHAKTRKTEAASGNKSGSLPGRTEWATNELLQFVGYMKNGDTSVLSKYDVQTLVLEHVRRNNLQDPCQNSQIVCDSKLMGLFGKERVDHLQMLKLLDYHFLDQDMSRVTSSSSRGGTEVIPIKTGADRNNDRLNGSEWLQGRESQQSTELNNHVAPSTSNGRDQAVVRSETSVALSKEFPSVDASLSSEPNHALGASREWLYRDPNGKIQGPFSMSNLRQWNSSGHFPPDLRVWRSSEKHNDSVLLTDALNGEFNQTGSPQKHCMPAEEVIGFSTGRNGGVDTTRVDSRVLDVGPNPVCADQSIISSSSSIITRNSVASNTSFGHNTVPLDFALSTERQALGSVPLWNKPKDDSPFLGQSQISCSLSLATFPGNPSTSSSLVHEKWNASIQNGNGLYCGTEKQVAATIGNTAQSCGQNWNAATPSSASTVLDTNSCLVSFTDNQEIDFLDLFSPTFKSSLGSTSADWQTIVANPDECDESVSDLLAEVEAMESQKGLPSSPTSSFRGPEELTRHSLNDCFSPADRLSPALDVSKGDAMSSTNDLQMHSRSKNSGFLAG
ncbi:PREDICTED: zinc finger CCCH domain-containing protein 44 [Tarenaya hassleriana]|uniref:zinc finger CCCH domain-containing protein 44 n=1 Tax=Tarenaya hassleriana TaxID=28532 RepID=UPI00053C879B|nr:PREDICTED: zinc finger CCCH domain-containing protein 44 [Tarenaya hassleriana]XP_019057423.1 PREDICTED: zinc finger CCCH domain-containing protein 44 [Tarenaya hassleriana]